MVFIQIMLNETSFWYLAIEQFITLLTQTVAVSKTNSFVEKQQISKRGDESLLIYWLERVISA